MIKCFQYAGLLGAFALTLAVAIATQDFSMEPRHIVESDCMLLLLLLLWLLFVDGEFSWWQRRRWR